MDLHVILMVQNTVQINDTAKRYPLKLYFLSQIFIQTLTSFSFTFIEINQFQRSN